MCNIKKPDESLMSLVNVAQKLIDDSISESTRRSYLSDWRKFCKFCSESNLESLPADPQTVVLWVAHRHNRGHKVSSIVRSITSIVSIHKNAGLKTPKTDIVSAAVRGLKRNVGVKKTQPYAITWEDLCLMIQGSWMFDEAKSVLAKRDSSLLSIGWFGAMRRSEIARLDISDIEISNQGILLTINRSKTDQDREGAQVAIPRLKSKFCPVQTTELWMDLLYQAGITRGPLFRSLGMAGKNFRIEKIGDSLGDRSISLIVKRYAKFISRNARDISSHSLRRGFITQCAAAGVNDRIIMSHTRHKSISVMRTYIDSGNIWRNSPFSVMPDFKSLISSD